MSRVLLIGSPNSGKSLLFNRLTGMAHKVANYPGITVDVGVGNLRGLPETRLVDFPGTYSLQPISAEERVAVAEFERALEDPEVEQVLCLIDSTRLEKSLYFTLQVIRDCARFGKPVTVLANMIDVLDRHSLAFDAEGLSDALKTPVLPISARSGKGVDAVVSQLLHNREAREPASGGAFADSPDALLRGTAHQLARRYGPKGDVLVQSQARLDQFFLGSLTGGAAFFLIMYLLFQSIFTWSAPAMDAVESSLAWLAALILPLIGVDLLRDFTADALFSGIGAFLVFVPQIFVLTFVIGLLEDSGYMARAALICHRPLRFFGLTGKSFIPMLSGVACAIPGIYAARSIDSPRRRFLTYMAIPLMPCSARLPVYALLIAAFIPQTTALGGLVGLQGLAMFLVYFLGLMLGLIVAGLAARRDRDPAPDVPFVLEMPPYRMPALVPLLRQSLHRCRHFVAKAGGVILGVTVVVWILGYFPNGGADLGSSWLAGIGRVIEPVFAPMGLDWRYGVAILTSFLAREVFVGTLGTIFGIEFAEQNMVPLVERIHSSGMDLASGAVLLVFFSVALMCVSTMAILARESGSWKLPAKMFAVYGMAGYVGAIIVYQGISLLPG